MKQSTQLEQWSEEALRAIDPATLPDELLKFWWFRHIASDKPRPVKADPEGAEARFVARERKRAQIEKAEPKIPEHFPREGFYTIDPRTIPEDLLKSWWASRNGRISGPKRLEKWREGLDPITIAEREAERKRIAKIRERSVAIAKGLLPAPEPKERCYCQKNTMKRAKARAFECCKKAGITPPRIKS